MLYVACCLWQPNRFSQPFSRCFDESWVNKLHNGFRRNLTKPFKFVVFVDRMRNFDNGIMQAILKTVPANYGCMIEPFNLNQPMILCGLDTIIIRNIDHLAMYCLEQSAMALPRDPYKPERAINAVALVPKNHRFIAQGWNGENDMEYIRRFPCLFIDDLFPRQVLSLKFHKIRDTGLPEDARIVYMHGDPKPDALLHLDWVREHWR